MVGLLRYTHCLTFEAEVQRCIARYHDSLTGEAEGSMRETFVQLCEQELNGVIDRYRNSMDSRYTFYFHTTQLHLYTLAVIREKRQTEDTGYLELGRVTRYQKLGMLAAHRLIDIYCDDIKLPDARLIDVYRALPKPYFIGVLLATFYLLRYFVLNSTCDAEQKADCRDRVLKVHAKLREFASHRFAEPGRAAAVIEVLCRHGQMQESDANSSIDDRGVASISWSALIAASNLRGMRNLKSFWLEKINPSSPDLQSGHQQSTLPDVLGGSHPIEPFEHGFPLFPESSWDQSFLQMLDFSAYDIDGTPTQ
ncbi:hypothetical protein H2200_000952 [Cladophialophora chaetospira]|uniref:Uncharacterized protein n=1 Tax=Cladophialophora chaetospira TaxID=386627 RepID=A0AA39CRI5_9EURO|nr:hypothetical protein H2200_000952 [Cladophialophora chaetospira]